MRQGGGELGSSGHPNEIMKWEQGEGDGKVGAAKWAGASLPLELNPQAELPWPRGTGTWE